MRDEGAPRWQIAFALGVSQKSVASRLQRIDTQLRPWTLDDELAVMRMARDGASFIEIGRRLARSPQGVANKWAVLMGTAMLPKHRAQAAPRTSRAEALQAEDAAADCEKHLQAILAANPNGFLAWSEKRVGVRGVAPCAPAFYPMREAA